MDWLSLSELAGKPIISWAIQMIRNRVRKSIGKTIELSSGEMSLGDSPWYPIRFTIRVVSKTPAKLRVVGMQYVVFHFSRPVHSGEWLIGSNMSSDGFEMKEMVIPSKANDDIQIQIAPLLIPSGVQSLGHKRWNVSGTIVFRCAFGDIYKPFHTPEKCIESEQRWSDYLKSVEHAAS